MGVFCSDFGLREGGGREGRKEGRRERRREGRREGEKEEGRKGGSILARASRKSP